MNVPPRQRLRLSYRKDDVLRYIGHQDLLRFVFRLLRRAEIPYATSGKFSPKPRVSFGPALPLGVTASREPLDVELAEGQHWDTAEVEAAAGRLAKAALPRDFLVSLAELAIGAPTLSKQVAQARYELEFAGDVDRLDALPRLLDGPLIVGHRGKQRDLQPAILGYTLTGCTLSIDSLAGSAHNLNIVQLARLITSAICVECTRMHRACLLTDTGEPL